MQYNQNSFKALFQFSNEGIVVANRQGVIILANPAAEKLFGYAPNELLNQSIEVLIPKKIASRHTELRESYHTKPGPRSMGVGRDLFAVKKDGAEFPVEVSLSPYSNHEGEFVIAFIIDITVRKQQEENIQLQKRQLESLTVELEKRVKDRTMILEEALQQLEQSREELQQSLAKEIELNEMKTRFVSMASHEFRTPLATMLSSLSLVAKYGEMGDNEKQQKHITRIKESIGHLTDLLNDVLSISKLEEGKISIELELFNIETFAAELIQELQLVVLEDKKIMYQHTGQKNTLLDKKSLRIILNNLISNAIKFSPLHQKIEVHTHVNDAEVTITVKDYGMGISKEDQENLFQRFFRSKSVTNIQGTGLGLHIVARYVELLNGTIQVTSQENEGTTFIILIPNTLTYAV